MLLIGIDELNELIEENASLKEEGKELAIKFISSKIKHSAELLKKDEYIAALEDKIKVLEKTCKDYCEYIRQIRQKNSVLEEKASIVDDAIESLLKM